MHILDCYQCELHSISNVHIDVSNIVVKLCSILVSVLT